MSLNEFENGKNTTSITPGNIQRLKASGRKKARFLGPVFVTIIISFIIFVLAYFWWIFSVGFSNLTIPGMAGFAIIGLGLMTLVVLAIVNNGNQSNLECPFCSVIINVEAGWRCGDCGNSHNPQKSYANPFIGCAAKKCKSHPTAIQCPSCSRPIIIDSEGYEKRCTAILPHTGLAKLEPAQSTSEERDFFEGI